MKTHKLEVGHSVHGKPGEIGIVYLNNYRIRGGKPWGGFVAERTYEISDADLREAMRHAETVR
jgi:hypothetical protein